MSGHLASSLCVSRGSRSRHREQSIINHHRFIGISRLSSRSGISCPKAPKAQCTPAGQYCSPRKPQSLPSLTQTQRRTPLPHPPHFHHPPVHGMGTAGRHHRHLRSFPLPYRWKATMPSGYQSLEYSGLSLTPYPWRPPGLPIVAGNERRWRGSSGLWPSKPGSSTNARDSASCILQPAPADCTS